MKPKVNPELRAYVEAKVLPEYAKNDAGHQLKHVNFVIRRSLKFASTLDDINFDVVYAVAAYHDVGHHIDAKNHERVSSEIFRDDAGVQKFFTPAEARLVAETIEDHRAGTSTPRSIYGKIVRSADCTIDVDMMMRRTYAYRIRNAINDSLDEIIEESRRHLIEKYGKSGYGRQESYFDDPEFTQALTKLQNLIIDRERFWKRYIKINHLETAVELEALVSGVDPRLRHYIKCEILPEYRKNDRAHGLIHIREVMRRAFVLNREFGLKLNPNMIYAAVAYHDIGKHIDSAQHEIVSADIFRKDPKMSEFFSLEERQVIAEAIEDHRSAKSGTLRSEYGKLISSADRNTRIEMVLVRSFFVGQDRQPETKVSDFLKYTFERLTKRYSLDDPEKMFYADQEYQDFLREMRELLKNKTKFKAKYCEVNQISSRAHTLAEESGVPAEF